MKVSIFLLVFGFCTNSIALAGGDHDNYFELDEFEQSRNLYYKTTLDTIKFENYKGKDEFVIKSTNLSIYNIEEEKQRYLFPEGSKEEIFSIFFESKIDSSGMVQFNNWDDGYDYQYRYQGLRNNRNISKRELSDKLIILTSSQKTKQFTLWTANKDGSELTKVKTFSDYEMLRIDVRNIVFYSLTNKLTKLQSKK